ncbi:prolyl oligopeptidase family serine peptidase, partial [bacterium]|nr:prolyl oligopeptidase family serine peptidase [bacterium]
GSETVKQLDKSGWLIEESPSKPGVMKELKWIQFKEDILKYDILPLANKIDKPVLLITGENDAGTPLEDQKKLYDKLSGPKEIHQIKDSGHSFVTPEHLAKVKQIIQNWIDKDILK